MQDLPMQDLPMQQDEWKPYVGKCILFAGVTYDTDAACWTLEEEEQTKLRLTRALHQLGIRCECESITFPWTDVSEGQRMCHCRCSYNRPYKEYVDEFFIEGLYQFSHSPECPLEFYLE